MTNEEKDILTIFYSRMKKEGKTNEAARFSHSGIVKELADNHDEIKINESINSLIADELIKRVTHDKDAVYIATDAGIRELKAQS